MIIVIEGADRTGKTTLAKQICDKFGYDYAHFGKPGKDPMKEYVDFLLALKRPTVCDRFFMGELIYGPMLRGSEPPPPLEVVTICRLLRRMGACFIHADTPLEYVRTRFKPEDEAVTWDQNAEAATKFRGLFKSLPLGKSSAMLYEGMPGEDAKILKDLEAVVKRQAMLENLTKGFTGIGTVQHGALVLVGEALNGRTSRFGLPFDASPCSQFLDASLRAADVNDNDVFVVNQDIMTISETLFHRSLGSYFVALGVKAQDKLLELDIPHEAIPHPQYWLRFHRNQLLQYSDKLAHAYDNYKWRDKNDHD